MEDCKQKIIDEKNQLDEKIVKLGNFIDTEAFLYLSWSERDRQRIQYGIMRLYSEILSQRIISFEEDE